MQTTRRTFLQSTAALVGGAAVGLTTSRGFREHGPVEVRTLLFSEDPIVMKARLFSDEFMNVFGIRVIPDKKEVLVEFPLSTIKEVVASPSRTARCTIRVRDTNGTTTDRMPVSVVAKVHDLKIMMGVGKDALPVWMALADVQRVL